MKTLLFVDDEPMVLQGLQRQLRPMHKEWDMNFTDGGVKALEFMAAHQVDIVISDMMMPGMDGSQLLTEVVKRHPQTVRIILSGHAEREAVLRLVGPAHQYLSKPCEAEELRRAITGAFALRDLLGNGRLKQLTTRIGNLPVLPALQNQLTEELRKDSPSVECVGEIISRDIGLTAKILQLVNSAFFGLAQPVSNATEATLYLGLNTIRSLALSAGIFSQYDQQLCKSFSLDALAQHSWVTGMLARHVAKLERKDGKVLEQCFLAGLLHDIGQLVLAFGLHEEYSEVIAKSARENLPVWQVEQELLGASHADVGAYLLALWGLPNPIIEAVARHHQPAQCAVPEFSPAIAVHAADVFAHELSGINTEITPQQLDTAYLTGLGLGERIEEWRTGCRDTIET
jgi:HD-like signal output (HDOD) protein/ActR/RegA family two-component response regulator